MTAARYRYYVDWNNDGDFSDPYEEITEYVFDASWEYGRDYASQLDGRSKAGSISITLDNSDSRFSTFNVASPLFGLASPAYPMQPGCRVRTTMTIDSGAEVIMCQGYLENIISAPGITVDVSTAVLTAYGVLASRCLQDAISTLMHTNITTGAAVQAVLHTAGFSATDRDIDTGQSTLARWWDATTAQQAMRDLEEAEAGFIRESKDGKIVFEDRAHRNAIVAAAARYGTGDPGDLFLWNPQQGDVAKGVFNHIEAAIRTFDLSKETTLWDLTGNAIELPEGQTVIVKAQVSGFPAVEDWTTVLYECTDGQSPAVDQTANVRLAVTKSSTEQILEFTNDGMSPSSPSLPTYLVSCRCKGIALIEGDPKTVWAEDAHSRNAYGYLPHSDVGKFFADAVEAQDRCAHLLAIYKDLQPIICFDLKANYDAAHLAEAQALDISRRIYVEANVPYGLYIQGDFWVESLKYTVGSDNLLTVSLQCSAVVPHVWPPSVTTYSPRTLSVRTHVFTDDDVTGMVEGDVWIYDGDTYIYDGVDWIMDKRPTNLICSAISDGLDIIFSVRAGGFSYGIDGADFRAHYIGAGPFAPEVLATGQNLTVPGEGGSLVHDGYEHYVVDYFAADMGGASYSLTSPNPGTWFYAFRLHNTSGWGPWSDGNKLPYNCLDYITVAEGTRIGSCTTVDDAEVVTLNCNMTDAFRVTIAGDRTLEIVGGSKCMQPVCVAVVQGAAGGNSLGLGDSIRLGLDIATITMSEDAGAIDYLGFLYDEIEDVYDLVSFVSGYA